MAEAASPLPGPSGCADNSFGPFAGYNCRGGFDFTLLFEESILTIPLQCLLLLMLPPRLLKLLKAQIKVKWGYQRPAKLVITSAFLGVSAAIMSLWANASDDTIIKTKATVPANALVFVSSVAVFLLSWLEHERSLRPSFILFIYLALSSLLDLARVRTVWMLANDNTIPILMTCSLVLKIVLIAVESIEKRGLITSGLVHSFEVTASTISRSLFLWLIPLFRLGFKKTLTVDDLYPLDERLHAPVLHGALAAAWEKVPDKTKKGALFNTWLKTFGDSMLGPVVPRLCIMGFTYAQPFLIQETIILAQLPRNSLFDNWGYGLIGAFALVYGGLAIAQGQYMWRIRRTATKMKASLFAMIYQKSLRLDLTAPTVSPLAGVTMVGTDTETIIGGMNLIHEIWASTFEIAIATWLIYRELGPACAMPIALTVVNLFVTVFVSLPIGKAQAAWIQASQERVTATSKTLSSIKRLRISGLNDMAFAVIRKLRISEMKASMKFRVLLSATLVLLIVVPLWSPILTFATWAGVAKNNSDTLSLGKVFASYLFIVLLASPLTQLLIALPALLGSVASFQRIQDHLNGKERKDSRNSLCGKAHANTSGEKGASSKPSGSNSSLNNASLSEKSGATSPTVVLDDSVVARLNGSFRWTEETDPVFNITNLDIQRGSLTFVVGPVGCGKSTLAKSFLGELSAFDGEIITNYTGVAYCDQNPWIPNETARKIIIGYGSFDKPWYQLVVKACALEQDLEKWPQGDMTQGGSQGITFSGGQKQRLAIARAMYSKKEFLIFDDVLSGLDGATENKVFTSVFGKDGLIRKGNMTVVATASSYARLRYADRIIVLDEKGKIANDGTPEELKDVLKLDEALLGWEAHVEEDEAKEQADAEEEAPAAADAAAATAPTDTTAASATVNAAKLEEDKKRRLGDSAMYMFYAKAAGRRMLVTLGISMAVYAFCQAFPTLWIGWWGAAADPLDDLGKWIGVYVALGVGAMLSVGTGIWQLLILIINRAGIRFHDTMVDTVATAPMSFYSVTDSGTTVNRFSQDLRLIDMDLPQALFSVATTTAAGIAQFILVCVAAKYMAAFLPILAGALYLIQFVYLRTSRQLRLLDIEQTAPLYTQLIETLSGLSTIRAFQWEVEFEEKNMGLINNALRPYYLLGSLQAWLNFVTDCFVFIVAVVFAVLATTLRDKLGAALIGTGLSNILSFSNSMKAFVTYWVMLETALGAVSRVRSFTESTPVEGTDEDNEEPSKENQWPSEGSIEIQNLTASYIPSSPVLNNISISIPAGQKVGVCGRTGSGKSSLTLCLLRMLEQDSGSIHIDGVDIKTLPHEYVRQHLVALPQESYVFDGTVRLNVDPEGTATDEDIIEVLKKVRLWAKVESRGDLDNVIHDDFFSPGESQLLVFARAMLRKSRVLILDEFTSSLDEEASGIVDELLKTSFEGWTIIAIAHKLQSIVDFDQVIVLDAGSLVESGAPRQLLEQDTSVFKDMFNGGSK